MMERNDWTFGTDGFTIESYIDLTRDADDDRCHSPIRHAARTVRRLHAMVLLCYHALRSRLLQLSLWR